jgi:hypothetical protein
MFCDSWAFGAEQLRQLSLIQPNRVFIQCHFQTSLAID